MKRKLFGLLITTLISIQLTAQNLYLDSLRNALKTSATDTNRVLLLANLAFIYQSVKSDSGIVLAQQGLILAKHLRFPRGEANCLNSLGSLFFATGNYPKALEFHLQALKIREQLHNPRGVAVSNNNIGTIYGAQGNHEQALNYYLKAKALDEETHAQELLIGVLSNIGDTYEKLDRLDSARMFTQQSYELAIKENQLHQQALALNNLGNIHAKMGQWEIALGFFRLGLPELISNDDRDAICETTLGIARVFDKTGPKDSALFFGRWSYQLAQQNGYTQRVLDASYFLSDYFNGKARLDSVNLYQSIIIALKDSLFSQERVREMQNLSFTEQIRQMEIHEKEELAREERWRNIQMLGIGAFIPLFFGIVLISSKRTAKRRTIEFLGLLGLLLLFETITLFLHPYIERWTHHSPVLMLLILVLIASVLVPTHHKMEHWVKEVLGRRWLVQQKEQIDVAPQIQQSVNPPVEDKENGPGNIE